MEHHRTSQFEISKRYNTCREHCKPTERHYCFLMVISPFSLFAQASLCWPIPRSSLAVLPGCRLQMFWVWIFVLLSHSRFICWACLVSLDFASGVLCAFLCVRHSAILKQDLWKVFSVEINTFDTILPPRGRHAASLPTVSLKAWDISVYCWLKGFRVV